MLVYMCENRFRRTSLCHKLWIGSSCNAKGATRIMPTTKRAALTRIIDTGCSLAKSQPKPTIRNYSTEYSLIYVGSRPLQCTGHSLLGTIVSSLFSLPDGCLRRSLTVAAPPTLSAASLLLLLPLFAVVLWHLFVYLTVASSTRNQFALVVVLDADEPDDKHNRHNLLQSELLRRQRLTARSRYCGELRTLLFPRNTLKYKMSSLVRQLSGRSQQSHQDETKEDKPLEEPILMYHESARSIVFRDHLRRKARKQEEKARLEKQLSNASNTQCGPQIVPHQPTEDPLEAAVHLMGLDQLGDETIRPSEAGIPDTLIAGFTPKIKPLEPLQLSAEDCFDALLESNEDQTDWTTAEREVYEMLATQQACVKTVKNTDWTALLERFSSPHTSHHGPRVHDDVPPESNRYPFTSFVSSTTLLPPYGQKMRCFGSVGQYTVGLVFALPTAYADGQSEEEACAATETWSWPAGYAAKTEFNIDGRGQLINGREEALRSLAILREYNVDYLTKDEYMVANRKISGLNQIPYNEVFLRIGGPGRIVKAIDVATQEPRVDGVNGRSLTRGVGLPVALFVRTTKYGHLIALLRARARLAHTLGEAHIKGIPLLLIDPALGVRVLTEKLQADVWKAASSTLNPFQNSDIAHKTTITNTDEVSFQQKVDELLDLDETISCILTPEELARIAGGFGATDESVASILRNVLIQDNRINKERKEAKNGTVREGSHKLQDVVNEGLVAAVRSGDYYTSRQLLILYSLVASLGNDILEDEKSVLSLSDASEGEHKQEGRKNRKRSSSLGRNGDQLIQNIHLIQAHHQNKELSTDIPPLPPPPPLDTDRLRSATNSDGLLAVLGAAQILKAMQNGTAKKRTQEAIDAIEEWVNYGENSMAFRISSWYDQRAAQGDLKIATAEDSNFMAFVSNKSISNRRNFAQNLRAAAEATNFDDGRFLIAISAIIAGMNKPCLRLELLQYVLGLDNRYSTAHMARSVELAATCLAIAAANERAKQSTETES